MDVLNLPQYPLKVKIENGKRQIFDEQRKRYIALTPEEWVRQHFVKFLCNELHYPSGRIGNEILIRANGLSRRCDSVIYGEAGNAIVICEYKAPEIKITQDVFDQIFSYNRELNVKYLIVSNGMNHFCCKINNEGRPEFLKEIPFYNTL